MSLKVLFNGAVLVKPSGATRVDASLFTSAGVGGVGVVALVGEADAGEPNAVQVFTSPERARRAFRAGPLAKAAALAFQPSNDPRITAGTSRLVCVKTNQSTKATRTLQGNSTGNALVAATNSAPYNLEPGQTVVVSVNGGPDATATFNAAAPVLDAGGAGPYTPLVNGDVLNITVDGEAQSLTITGLSTKTAAEVAAILNPLVRGGFFSDNAGTLRFTGDKRGTSASVQVTGGTANAGKLAFSTTAVPGSGNVANIDAVSAAEAKTIIEAAVVGVTVSGSPVQIVANTAGHTLRVQPSSTALGFGFPTTLVTPSSPVNAMKVDSLDYGAHTNKISIQVSDSGGGKVLEVTFEDGTKKTTETSPVLGATAEFTLQYTGNGSTATATITATQLTTSISGQTDGSLNLTVPFSTFTTLQEVINYINAQPGYLAVAVTPNPFTFNPANLDYVTAVSIRPSAASFFAKLFRCIEWVNGNSSLVSATREATGANAPNATTGKVLLTGGTRGTSTNTSWQDALAALGQMDVNEVVPLISEDLAGLGQGSTATFASVAAQTDAHAAFYSSTKGRRERQAYIGMKATKAAFIAQAGVLNSIHTCLSSQKVTALNEVGTLEVLPEWAFAVLTAGLRAGAPLGEPLTHKYIRVTDITQDASWNPEDDGEDLLLAGCFIAESVPGRGVRIVKGNTTYTREDNDAYTEESIVMGWKNVAFELRTHLEDLFTGRRLSITNLQGVRSAADAKLNELRNAGQIVDSILPDGTTLRAYRELSVTGSGDVVEISVVVSPVAGINFTLNNLFLVPATISL